jgi:hypothetical protein
MSQFPSYSELMSLICVSHSHCFKLVLNRAKKFSTPELGGETEARVVATECDCAGCPVGGLGCTCARSVTSLCVQCVDVNCPCAVCVCASTPAVCTRCTPVQEEDQVHRQEITTKKWRKKWKKCAKLGKCTK